MLWSRAPCPLSLGPRGHPVIWVGHMLAGMEVDRAWLATMQVSSAQVLFRRLALRVLCAGGRVRSTGPAALITLRRHLLVRGVHTHCLPLLPETRSGYSAACVGPCSPESPVSCKQRPNDLLGDACPMAYPKFFCTAVHGKAPPPGPGVKDIPGRLVNHSNGDCMTAPGRPFRQERLSPPDTAGDIPQVPSQRGAEPRARLSSLCLRLLTWAQSAS